MVKKHAAAIICTAIFNGATAHGRFVGIRAIHTTAKYFCIAIVNDTAVHGKRKILKVFVVGHTGTRICTAILNNSVVHGKRSRTAISTFIGYAAAIAIVFRTAFPDFYRAIVNGATVHGKSTTVLHATAIS